jgi:hypothetical protein
MDREQQQLKMTVNVIIVAASFGLLVLGIFGYVSLQQKRLMEARMSQQSSQNADSPVNLEKAVDPPSQFTATVSTNVSPQSN